jgi:hydroxypyruvate reductase
LIDPALPEDTVVLCAATDGVDGSSGAAGACVCKLLDGGARREELQQALDRFDDSPVHRGLGTRLAFEPTGINLTDVYVVARPKN